MSNLFNLNFKDLFKSLLVAIFAPLFAYLLEVLNANSFDFDLKKIVTISLTACLSYLLKNFITNSKGEFLKKD